MTTTRTIETDANLAKLARTLEVDASEVEFLAYLDVGDLRDLRWRINDRLNSADAKRLQGVMAASKLVPIGLAATIGEKWFGPILCARLVGLVEPKRGGQYARHLSVEFMADITTRTDPRVVGDLIHELRLPDMQAIANNLLDRGDYLTLSHFVGHLPPTVVADILAAIDDNAAVVRIARYVEDLGHLDPVVALLPDERLVALVRAVDHEDLWVDGLYLFSHLSADQVSRIASIVVSLGDQVVVAAIEAFDRHDLWDQGLALLAHLSDDEMQRVAGVLDLVDDNVIAAALVHIARQVEDLMILDTVVARLPDERLISIVKTVQREDLWVDGLHLFSHLSADQVARIATTIVHSDIDIITAALAAFDRHGLWAQGLHLVEHLDPGDMGTFADVLLTLDDGAIATAVDAIDANHAWDTLVHIALAVEGHSDKVRARLRHVVDTLPKAQVKAFEKAARTLGHPNLLTNVLQPMSSPAEPTRPLNG
ncbi:MAG: hypothetical protein ACRD0U_03910 [Acidimicrobiales bacterium]